MKKIISVLLAVLMLFSFSGIAFAQETEEVLPIDEGTLRIFDYNVDGLPIPASLSSSKKDPVTCAESIVEYINANDYDIVTMQENFNFYSVYKKGLKQAYVTEYDGGAAVGDGLGIASVFPLYNVKHVAWDTAYGVYDSGNDELTPKGFMVATAEISDGVYVDIYTLHADAFEDDESLQAKCDQFDQLCKFIDSYSGDRAVILTGDFNSNFTIVLGDAHREKFVARGFKDTWIEACEDGNYNVTYDYLYEKYDHLHYWGHYDCLDHIYYRDGADVKFDEVTHEYVPVYAPNTQGEQVMASDHWAIVSTLGYKIYEKIDAPEKLDVQPENDLLSFIDKFCRAVFRDIILLLRDLPAFLSGEKEIIWIK